MNLFEQIITTMAKHDQESKSRPKIIRKKIGECPVCKFPLYNTSSKKDDKPRFSIIKNSVVSDKGKGFSVVNVGAITHNCVTQFPTQFTAQLFIDEFNTTKLIKSDPQ